MFVYIQFSGKADHQGGSGLNRQGDDQLGAVKKTENKQVNTCLPVFTCWSCVQQLNNTRREKREPPRGKVDPEVNIHHNAEGRGGGNKSYSFVLIKDAWK